MLLLKSFFSIFILLEILPFLLPFISVSFQPSYFSIKNDVSFTMYHVDPTDHSYWSLKISFMFSILQFKLYTLSLLFHSTWNTAAATRITCHAPLCLPISQTELSNP